MTAPLESITSTASAMLLKVLCKTDAECLSSSCAAVRCSAPSATPPSTPCFTTWLALSDQAVAVGIIPGRLDQLGECRRDAADGGVVFAQELRVAVEGKTARRALRLPNQ